MNHDYVKLVVRRLYDAQKLRIQSDLRLQRLIREEIVLKEEAEKTFGQARKLEEDTEKEYERIVWREIRNERIVKEWLIRVRGIGPRLAGLLVALIGDIGKFSNVSKLWAYAGLHVVNGRAAKRSKGERANWSDELKTTAWKIGKSFVKAGGPYAELYRTYKQYLIVREVRNGNVIWGADDKGKYAPIHAPIEVMARAEEMKAPEKPEWTLGRIDNMATRRTVKIFLSHLWDVWRTMEGLPTDGPFVQERLGHESRLDPWDFVEPEKEKRPRKNAVGTEQEREVA